MIPNEANTPLFSLDAGEIGVHEPEPIGTQLIEHPWYLRAHGRVEKGEDARNAHYGWEAHDDA